MLIRYGNFLFRYRNILFPCILFLLLVIFEPRPFGGNMYTDRWLDALGILIILLGQAIRAMVIGLVYIKRGGVNKKIHADTLVTTGIFAHCRNPLYVGNLLILCGFFIIHNNPWATLAGAGFFLLSYIAIVLAEESFLKEKFGTAFDDYCRTVNRWLFRANGIRTTLASMRFNWMRVLSKDYTTVLTWFITILFILTQEHIIEYGLAGSSDFIAGIIALMIGAGVIALVIRILKKSGRLAGKQLF